MAKRSNARETTRFALGIHHVTHPFVEERCGVGKERARLGEDLRIGSPAQSLVTLRTVGRYGQIVRTLSPQGVGDQFVYHVVARGDGTAFHLFRDRSDGDRLDLLDGHFVGSRDRNKTVAKEGSSRQIGSIVSRIGEGIFQLHAGVGDSEVQAVNTSFRTIHATALGSVSVVEKF